MAAKRWTVREFARFAFDEDDDNAVRRARRTLQGLDARHGGALLRGERTVLVSRLRRLEPDLFAEVPCLEWRVAELEERAAAVRAEHARLAMQSTQTARDLARMRRPPPSRSVRYVWPDEEREAAE